MKPTNFSNCTICNNPYKKHVLNFLICPNCKLIYSKQKAGFGNPIQGMQKIAFDNYYRVANVLEKTLDIKNSKILDVGCAEGGFTEILLSMGANPLGIEPDKASAFDAIKKKLPLELSGFEEMTSQSGKFDVIVFNDVFEHMQDPCLSLKKSDELLKKDGYILINLPVSKGLIFKIVLLMAKLGIKSPYKRIWAQGLSSPHIYFYNDYNIELLLSSFNFKLIEKGPLISISSDGMFKRVRSTYGVISSIIISLVALCFVSISKFFPPDVMYLLFKKNEEKK